MAMNQDPLYPGVGAPPVEEPMRQGDSGLGLPDPEPAALRRLSAEESEAYVKQCEAEWREQFERRLADLESVSTGFELPRGLRNFFSRGMLLAASLMAIFLITQMIHATAELATLPPEARWPIGGALALAGSVVLYFVARLLWLYLRLKTHKQINIKALGIIAERRRMQAIAEEKSSEARKAFSAYLRDYPLARVGSKKFMMFGVTPADFEKLGAARDRLLDPAYANTSRQWLEEFGAGFQAILDRAAESRIASYSVKAGLATSTSPNTVMDQLIVLYSCTAMIGDLLKIYNVRPAMGQTGAIMAQAITHAYLSGMLDGMTEHAANSLGDTLSGLAGATGAELVGIRVAKVVSAKLAEGTLNGLLIRRLGRQVIRLLQPVRQ